jgi:hypothetical protein
MAAVAPVSSSWTWAAGVPPVRPETSAVSAGCAAPERARRNETWSGMVGVRTLPRHSTFPSPIVGSASSAARTAAEVASQAIGAVVDPAKEIVYVPPVGVPRTPKNCEDSVLSVVALAATKAEPVQARTERVTV